VCAFDTRCAGRRARPYLGPAPATKKIQAICDKISLATRRHTTGVAAAEQVGRLNAMLLVGSNYFRIGDVLAAWQTVQQHACRRLRWWLQRKHGNKGRKGSTYPAWYLHERLGLGELERRGRR